MDGPNNAAVGRTIKTRKRKRNETAWNINRKKLLRNSGKAYSGRKNKPHTQRSVKPYEHTCRYKCSQSISEEERRDIFQRFYALADYDLQNSFISSCIRKRSVKRKRNDATTNKQFSTEIYFLNKRVCKMFFLKTLDISNKRFTTVCAKTDSIGICAKDQRGTGLGRKMEPARRTLVMEHIQMFPKYTSHYSRKSNLNTRYLSPELNVKKMFSLYKEYCTEKDATPVKESYYRYIFNTQFNLRFHRPNSDTCSKCDTYENIIKHSQDEIKIKEVQIKQEVHHKKAEKALATKKSDVLNNRDSADTCVICFDLQQALPTPLITTSKVFYLRQLWTYNFCVHNLVTGKSHMYVWNETVASRGSQEIGSCLIRFINVLPDNITRIIAYSDSCGGQNKNKNIAKLFMFLVKSTKIQEIHHKFLEPGHTFMECDQDFGIIEKVKRKIPQIFIPEHWRTVIQESSKKFTVHEMKRENFYNFAQLNQIISDPKKNTDNHVIRWREIQYFFYSKAAQTFSFQHKPTLDIVMPFYTCMCPSKTTGRPNLCFENAFSMLNEGTLKIKEAKWKNLQSLLDFIPPIYHEFYNSIQYEGKGNEKKKGKNSSSTSKQAIAIGRKKAEKKPEVNLPEETGEDDDEVPEDVDLLYSDDE